MVAEVADQARLGCGFGCLLRGDERDQAAHQAGDGVGLIVVSVSVMPAVLTASRAREPGKAPARPWQLAATAHRSAAPTQRIDLGIAKAVERQTRAMRELCRRAILKPDVVPEDAPTLNRGGSRSAPPP
ncbi:hypothetical protein ACFQ6V_14880 [Streptomyces roseifaciens]